MVILLFFTSVSLAPLKFKTGPLFAVINFRNQSKLFHLLFDIELNP